MTQQQSQLINDFKQYLLKMYINYNIILCETHIIMLIQKKS